MKKTIPSKLVMVCDICKKDDSTTRFRAAGELHIKQHALDYQGSPCANGDMKIDICDTCLPKIITAINARAQTIRDHGE